MRRFDELPVAVTIAGSDSGGGAGIQADLKTFAALGVHGLTVITNVTAQSPKRVRAIEPCSSKMVRSQLETVYRDFRPAATKTGMLYSDEIIRAVARFLKRLDCGPIVIDPVMISTSGRVLLKPKAVEVMRNELFPRARLITPNVPEAESLLGQKIKTLADLKTAAHKLHDAFGCAILLKGGHLQSSNQATDIFFDGKEEAVLSVPRIRNIKTHGTGCTYSAAITAFLARGLSLKDSVREAKAYVTRAISGSSMASDNSVLGWNNH